MSLQGKYSPLEMNFMSGLISGEGINVNSEVRYYAGESTLYTNYTPGSLVNQTCLDKLVAATRLAFTNSGVSPTTYSNLISIGSESIPLLGNSKPETYIFKYEGEIASFGFARMIALQACTEAEVNSGSLADFCSSFTKCYSHKTKVNKVIGSMVNAKDYLEGVYSNMDDLATSDITGVNLATTYWGQDLIKLGRAIDLADIDRFGMPSLLLKNLQRNGAITNALGVALMLSGLTTNELGTILASLSPVTEEQEKKIYVAFQLITGVDLLEILIVLNVQTSNITLLADLLNPIKMFPNSYTTLTTPKYNATQMATNSKTYYFIYDGNGVNSQLADFGFKEKYNNVIPDDLAIACGAFSHAMMQIKNITKTNFEKFAQIVTNIETMKGLDVNGTEVPVNAELVDGALEEVALGSGVSGSFTMCDFYGAMSGISYKLFEVKEALTNLQTDALTEIYNSMYELMLGPGPYNASLQSLIDQANQEILNIQETNKTYTTVSEDIFTGTPEYTDFSVKVAIDLWLEIGKKLSTEIKARVAALPDDVAATGVGDIISFAEAVTNVYALETSLHGTAAVIEKILDVTTLAGRSGIGAMRETRNASRLGLMGATLDNNIDPTLPQKDLPNNLGIEKITGDTPVLGSLAGSNEKNLVPQNLDIFKISTTLTPSVYTPKEALDIVTENNCNCWS